MRGKGSSKAARTEPDSAVEFNKCIADAEFKKVSTAVTKANLFALLVMAPQIQALRNKTCILYGHVLLGLSVCSLLVCMLQNK